MLTKPVGAVDLSDPVIQSVMAAADYMGTGALEVPVFESDIFDIVRRSSPALQRIKQKPATGHPHRYFEQTGIATGASVDPRNISNTASGPTRVERPVFIKAVSGQSNLSLFDKEVTEQQGQFAGVIAQDIDDIVSGIEIQRANMLWNGTDTSLVAPTTLQWVGGLTQITLQFSVSPSASIIDGLKTAIANMVANTSFVVKPTAIFVNPVLNDYIDQEAKASHIELTTMEVVAGVVVNALATQAGKIPLIPDVYLSKSAGAAFGFSAPAAGLNNYYAVIVTEPLIEIAVISGKSFDPKPRLFQLGLIGNLASQFVGVKFDSLVFKGASYAHAVVAVQRA